MAVSPFVVSCRLNKATGFQAVPIHFLNVPFGAVFLYNGAMLGCG